VTNDKEALSRREMLRMGIVIAATGAVAGGAAAETVPAFDLEEANVDALQAGMTAGRYTAANLVERYRARIAAVDAGGPHVNAVIELNPDADAIAAQRDAERASGHVRGPLHGIPVLIKDNIATRDRMQTTAGSFALMGSIPPRDAAIVTRLRDAGAVILGKTNLSEWANFRSTHASSGWSGRGGQTRNPYALDRTPSGSSSGTGAGIAANLAAVGVGTETDGSITSPSAANSLVGLKPTVGLVSRAGIVPISHTQDTAGPMARTVRDAAILLGVLAGVDPADPATQAPGRVAYDDYTPFLRADGLSGARIGISRSHFFGYSAATDKIAEDAIAVLRAHGAVIVDPADLATAGQFDDSELTVLLYEFKEDLNRYLAALEPGVHPRDLAAIIKFNNREAGREMPFFAQELLLQAQAKGPLTDDDYRKALAKDLKLSRAESIDAVLDKHKLDALFAPTQGPPWLIDLANGDAGSGGSCTSPAAVAGYPHITVPAGYYHGLPIGVSFFGRAWSEPVLLRLAYAYEQATHHRVPPTFPATAPIPYDGRAGTT
jgi:amidase